MKEKRLYSSLSRSLVRSEQQTVRKQRRTFCTVLMLSPGLLRPFNYISPVKEEGHLLLMWQRSTARGWELYMESSGQTGNMDLKGGGGHSGERQKDEVEVI